MKNVKTYTEYINESFKKNLLASPITHKKNEISAVAKKLFTSVSGPAFGFFVLGTTTGPYKFEARIFDLPSKYGIDKGKISMLIICDGKQNGWDNEIIYYDRKWLKPVTPEMKPVYDTIIELLDKIVLPD